MTARSFASITKIVAPRDVVWAVMTDHSRYVRWASTRRLTMEKRGQPDPNGVGAVRVFHTGPIKVREEVLEFEPPTRMVYSVVSGFPVRDHRSEMLLEENDDVTVLTWASSFSPRIPFTGGTFERIMLRAIDRFAEGIKEDAEEALRGEAG
jgi:uncharacterized protein YndB with AHSA1/START domain